MAHDVAISYASEDIDAARALAEALSEAGLSVFFDQDAEAKIASWGRSPRTMLREVYGAARCCIVVVSPRYLMSEWTRLELRSAKNALPVVLEPVRPAFRSVADLDWPAEGPEALVPLVREKLAQLDAERAEGRSRWKRRLVSGAGVLAATAAGIAATAAANRRTQDRIEENTGSIDGHWTDQDGIAWKLTQDDQVLHLRGAAPNGVEIHAAGSRHGASIRAEWSNGANQGAITAEVTDGGRRISGHASGPFGPHPFVLTR